MFKKLLIANRGEIACRIMRSAQRLGIHCVAIYSDADRQALHVKQADSSYCVGPAASAQSYLNRDAILEVAEQQGVDAIHPGYGFLSENADFAEQCQQAGIVFIGPSAEAIRAMGDKSAAKRLMQQAQVSVTPGYHGDDQDLETLQQAAAKIGYPLLIKAAAGGGGKGMRLVEHENQLTTAIAGAKREAHSSFGNERLLLEKYLKNPRHIEIQVMADQQGNCIHLFERDCSIQRRHQKIIEQAPAPLLSDELRQQMGAAAVAAAQAINYVGAGTIEFLVSDEQQFYFMEMNTRLQVEHPVTELITGFDLVEWQLSIAAGNALPVTQDQVQCRGQAFEVRIYAEDPQRDFLPSSGCIEHLTTPKPSEHCRIDSGITQGDSVSPYYDPLLAKLIVWDDTRQGAVNQLQQALKQWHMSGIRHNVSYLHAITQHSDFTNGHTDTHFIDKHHDELLKYTNAAIENSLIIACFYQLETQHSRSPNSDDRYSPWNIHDAWQLNQAHCQMLKLNINDHSYIINITHQTNSYELQIENHRYEIQGTFDEDGTIEISINHQWQQATIVEHGNELVVFCQGNTHTIQQTDPWHAYECDERAAGHLSAPMPGTIVAVMTKDGQQVNRGDTLLIIEAMKMEHTIHAPSRGTVKAVHYAQGDQVDEGSELLAFEALEE